MYLLANTFTYYQRSAVYAADVTQHSTGTTHLLQCSSSTPDVSEQRKLREILWDPLHLPELHNVANYEEPGRTKHCFLLKQISGMQLYATLLLSERLTWLSCQYYWWQFVWWKGKDLEGDGHALLNWSIPTFMWTDQRKLQNQVSSPITIESSKEQSSPTDWINSWPACSLRAFCSSVKQCGTHLVQIFCFLRSSTKILRIVPQLILSSSVISFASTRWCCRD
jgi:hypothetical protein